MYLSKQWRESRIISGLAILALVLLLAGTIKLNFFVGKLNQHPDPRQISNALIGFAIGIFYMEALVIGFWGWLAASIGIGKNLGEESGSFLFTRTRLRAWFLWNDWAFAMTQIAIITLITNLLFGFWLERIARLGMHTPGVIALTEQGQPISLVFLMALISIGCLLFAGFIYSVTYFSTIALKHQIGMVLGAGVLAGYVMLGALLQHYYSIKLPSLIPGLFHINRDSNGLSNHLALNFAIRAAVMLAFPIAAQLILNRSEI